MHATSWTMNTVIRPILTTAALMWACGTAGAQTAVYEIPFASTGNTIELEISNVGDDALDEIAVLPNVPEWIRLAVETPHLTVDGKATGLVRMRFDVDEAAPIDTAHPLSFVIETGGVTLATKEISVRVSAPGEVELRPNYPNPADLSTTVEFILTEPSHVRLTAYDILGRKVAELVHGELAAGLHKRVIPTDGLASGSYVVRLDVDGSKRVRETQRLVIAR